MSEVVSCQGSMENLRGRVVIVTGGSQGIGLAIVNQLYANGSIVVFGDRSVEQGQAVAASLAQTATTHDFVAPTFLELDVAKYDSVLNIFQKTLGLHGRVDCVVHAAGITERPGWFHTNLSMESVAKCPSTDIFQINLIGSFYVCHIAVAAMQQDRDVIYDKSIVLFSSVAGFKDSPGLFSYSATKHGVIGLMRSARDYLPDVFRIRINVICPWATDTPMFSSVRPVWVKENLPLNSADQVGRIGLEVAGDPSMNGKALYVAGGKAVDIDHGINELEPQWLGPQNALALSRGQEILGLGSSWSTLDANRP